MIDDHEAQFQVHTAICPSRCNGTDICQGNTQSREVSPNRGFSITDHFEEKNEERIDQAIWRKANNIHRSEQVKLVKVSHMRYQHEDLQQITTFLRGARDCFSLGLINGLTREFLAQISA